MNERQYDLVKLFLNHFYVPARKLAREWKIPLELVKKVDYAPNFEAFDSDSPLEDMLKKFKGL